MYIFYRCIVFLIIIFPNWAEAQIEESTSYIDSTATSRYTCITTFYSDDKGFTFTENKIYRANNLVEFKSIVGNIVNIDTDSIFYGKNKNQKVWIRFQTIKGENFDYTYSLKNKNKFIRYKQDNIKTYVIELPENKAQKFLKTVL